MNEFKCKSMRDKYILSDDYNTFPFGSSKYLNIGDEDTLLNLYMSLTSYILKKDKMFILF